MANLRRHRYRWAWAILASFSICLVAALFTVGPKLVARQLNRMDLAGLVSSATEGGTFSSAPLFVRFLPRPQIIVIDGQLSLPGRGEVQWKKARIFPNLLRLMIGQLKLNEIRINQPTIRLIIPRAVKRAALIDSAENNQALISRFLAATEWPRRLTGEIRRLAALSPLRRIQIRNGELQLKADPAFNLTLHDTALDLRLNPDSLRFELACQGSMWKTLTLKCRIAADAPQGSVDLHFQDLQIASLYSLIPDQMAGVKLHSLVSGSAGLQILSPSHVEGTLSMHAPSLTVKRLKKTLAVESLLLQARLALQENQLTIRLARLKSQAPQLALTGSLQVSQKPVGLRIDLAGQSLDLAQVRQATLALAGDNETVSGIFDVLRAGSLRYVAWHTQGHSAQELGRFRNMIISGEIQNGALFIPGAELALDEVNGAATISEGQLMGENLRARLGSSTGDKGQLWLDLDHPTEFPFTLQIDVKADVAQLPPLLKRWTAGTALAKELTRLQRFSGEAQGQLRLDGRNPHLEVAADVVRCRIQAAYSRIPMDITVQKGRVHYTNRHIAVDRVSGLLGRSRFAGLAARIDFAPNPMLQISSAQIDLDLKEVIPWAYRSGALESQGPRLQVDGTTAHVASLRLQGPFFNPAEWRFRLHGAIAGLRVQAAELPDMLRLNDAQVEIDEKGLDIKEAKLALLDAALSVEGRAAFNDHRLQTYAAVLVGQLGGESVEWLLRLARCDRYFKLKPPLALSNGQISWGRDQPLNIDAAFETAEHVSISLDSLIETSGGQQTHIRIQDHESQAKGFLRQAPDLVEFDFQGILSGKTLGRILAGNSLATGRLEGEIQGLFRPTHPDQSQIAGQLSANNLPFPFATGYAVHINQLQLQAEDNNIRILPSSFLVDGNRHTLAGNIRIAPRVYQIAFQHSADHLTLAEPQSGPPPSAKTPSAMQWLTLPIEGQIDSRINSLRIGEYRWTSVVGQIKPHPGRWAIDLAEANLCGLQTHGHITLTPQSVAFEMMPEARDASIDTTLNCLLNKPGLIDGSYKLNGTLKGAGPYDAIRPGLDGKVKLRAKQGRIHRFSLLGRVLAVINLTEVVRGKIPDLLHEGLAYQRIDINASISKGVIKLEKAVIDGDSLEIAAEGSIDLNDGQTDLIVLVAPLKTVDAIVKHTPIVNTWLGGTLISIPVRVTGPFDDPQVTPLSPTAVGSSLLNLLKNTVQLPIKLVEPLFKEDE